MNSGERIYLRRCLSISNMEIPLEFPGRAWQSTTENFRAPLQVAGCRAKRAKSFMLVFNTRILCSDCRYLYTGVVSVHSVIILHSHELLTFQFQGPGPYLRVKVKVKVHTLDIAPLRLINHHCRSIQVWHMFSRDLTVLPAQCTPTRSSAIGKIADSSAFAFPAAAGTHLPTPEGWKAE